jgi:hypothetical protein
MLTRLRGISIVVLAALAVGVLVPESLVLALAISWSNDILTVVWTESAIAPGDRTVEELPIEIREVFESDGRCIGMADVDDLWLFSGSCRKASNIHQVGDTWIVEFFAHKWFAFIVLILVLVFRPQGLLGERVGDRA